MKFYFYNNWKETKWDFFDFVIFRIERIEDIYHYHFIVTIFNLEFGIIK